MNKLNKTSLMTTVACAAFGLTLLPAQVYAFDEVNWEWNKLVTEDVVKNVNITIDSNPTGMVEIEKIQAHIGDVNATSTVTGIDNNAFGGIGEGATVLIDETITVTTNYDKPIGVGNAVSTTSGLVTNDPNGQITGTFIEGNLSEQSNAFTDIIDVQLTGEFDVEAIDGLSLDAVDLPEVSSVATAVGNNQTINSSVSVDLHDGQFLIGGFAEDGTAEDLETVLGALPDSGNTMTDIAGGLLLSAALGLIEPAQVSAVSTVDDITNASVDSVATAVGNNMTVDVAATTPDDAMVIADLTQFGYADITATSSVTNISVDDYTNFGGAGFGPLGDPQKPLVNSVATAVGNNMAITVTSPTL